jgi:hypothetical protein
VAKTAAIVTVVLVGGLGASSCGGGSGRGDKSRAAEERAIASYGAGLQRWGRQMIGALNGMSLLFSNPEAVQQLAGSKRVVGARLDRFERTLAGCTTVVKRLGPPPEALVVIHRHALRACARLEKGARLVRLGVRDFQTGLGFDRFTQATGPLNDGQGDIGLVKSELKLTAAESG